MKEYRIVEWFTPKSKQVEYFIQKKGWFFWTYLDDACGEYSNSYQFKSKEEAIAFIEGGCQDPNKPVTKVIEYVEL